MFHAPTMKLLILCYLFSYTFTLCSHLVMINQFSHHCPCKTTDKAIILSVLIFTFLDSVWGEKGIRTD